MQLHTRPYEKVTVRVINVSDEQLVTETVAQERAEVLTEPDAGSTHTTA